MYYYNKIAIIGYGKIAKDILQYVIEHKGKYGYEIEFVQHMRGAISVVEYVCEKYNVPFYFLPDKKQVQMHFCMEEKNTLIISAGNYYIFPSNVIDKENITIINFHNALLPKYPGRNVTSWVIYNDEAVTGATWHYVTKGIDEGNYIFQKSCLIEKDIKAYMLDKKIMNIAYEGFVEVFDDIMCGEVKGVSQKLDNSLRKMYYSYEIPGDGKFNINDSIEKIYTPLRAVDYGKFDVFPKIRTKLLNGEEVEILSYEMAKSINDKVENILVNYEDKTILLPQDRYVLKLKYNICENDRKER